MRDLETVRLSDVAAAAGVSVATASRVLSGSPQRVSERLHERVIEAARHLQYVPNAHAQALVRSTTSTVGLIVHDGSDPYFSEIGRGVFQAAREHDFLVLICNTYREPGGELRYVSALRAQRVQAVILAGSGLVTDGHDAAVADELRAFESTGGRVVVIGRRSGSFDSVRPDNIGGGRTVGRFLAAQGHRDIGVVAGPANLTTIQDRLRGVREGLSEAGLRLADHAVVYTTFDRDGGFRAVDDLLTRAPGVTAVFALNDTMAVGVLAALRRRGIDVPLDMSIVGFDDIPAVRDVTPALTTVHLPMEKMGRRAVDLALKPRSSRARRVPIAAALVERQSTAPPRASC